MKDRIEQIEDFIEDIYDLRKKSIAEDGEYGIGNLVFKEMRARGYLDNLKELKNELKSKQLSLESLNEDGEGEEAAKEQTPATPTRPNILGTRTMNREKVFEDDTYIIYYTKDRASVRAMMGEAAEDREYGWGSYEPYFMRDNRNEWYIIYKKNNQNFRYAFTGDGFANSKGNWVSPVSFILNDRNSTEFKQFFANPKFPVSKQIRKHIATSDEVNKLKRHSYTWHYPSDGNKIEGGQAKLIKHIEFDADCTRILSRAFSNCTALEEVIIPSRIKSIGPTAFYGCTSLKNVTIENGVTKIGRMAFGYCTSLKELVLPDSVTKVEDYLIYDCESLERFVSSKNVEKLSYLSWRPLNLKELVIDGVKTLYNLFESCPFETFIIPDSVTTIDYGLFGEVGNLKKLFIPKSVTTFTNTLFSYRLDTPIDVYVEAEEIPEGWTSTRTRREWNYYGDDREVTDVISWNSTWNRSGYEVNTNIRVHLGAKKEDMLKEGLNEEESGLVTVKPNGVTTRQETGMDKFNRLSDIDQQIIEKIAEIAKITAEETGDDPGFIAMDMVRDLQLINGDVSKYDLTNTPEDQLTTALTTMAQTDGLNSNKALRFLLDVDLEDIRFMARHPRGMLPGTGRNMPLPGPMGPRGGRMLPPGDRRMLPPGRGGRGRYESFIREALELTEELDTTEFNTKTKVWELVKDIKEDGTYSFRDGELKKEELSKGYQVSFFRPEITDSEVTMILNTIGNKLGPAYIGVYGDPEISYTFFDEDEAMNFAKIFNQYSAWNNEIGKEVKNTEFNDSAKVDYKEANDKLIEFLK